MVTEDTSNRDNPRTFNVRIDEQSFSLTNVEPTGRDLLSLVGRDPEHYFLVFVVEDQPDQVVELDEPFSLAAPGAEKFILVSKDRKFTIQIDETSYTVIGPKITGRQILELAGMDAEGHFVTQVIPNAADVVIGIDEVVDLTKPGRERFTVVERDRPNHKCQIDIEGRLFPWEKDTITTEELIALGGWPSSEGVLIINPDNTERTLAPGEVISLDCGVCFSRRRKFRRG